MIEKNNNCYKIVIIQLYVNVEDGFLKRGNFDIGVKVTPWVSMLPHVTCQCFPNCVCSFLKLAYLSYINKPKLKPNLTRKVEIVAISLKRMLSIRH